jgi:hypothetical protein
MNSARPPIFILLLSVAAVCASCTAPRGPLVVTDPDPSIKIPAMAKAVREHDASVIPQLIKDLDSDDAAVRFYAIHALHALTGEQFGYTAYMDENQRASAITQWKHWLDDQAEPDSTKTANAE